MVISQSKKLAMIVLLVGVVSVVMGSIFIAQSIDKSGLITEAMSMEKVEYDGTDATIIEGIVDTPVEAQEMAYILREHRVESCGYYTDLARDDPRRETIIKAITLENALNLAQVGYGLSEVVKYTGIFMVIIGLALGLGAASIITSRKQS